MRHALDYFDERNEFYDAVLSIQPTAPLLKSRTIHSVVEKFHRTDCDAVFTVSLIEHAHPYLAKVLDGDETDIATDFLELSAGFQRYPRQVRPEIYYSNGAVFLRDRKMLEDIDESTNCLGLSPRVVVMSAAEATNIDSEFDFLIAEFLIAKLREV